MMEIKETTAADLKSVQRLWADGDVMKFIGFADGLIKTDEEMKDWYLWIESNRPVINHYSIFEDGVYCGESFYAIDAAHRSAALDIKLFGFARGRGIAAAGLSHAVEEAFRNGAQTVWVDPNPQNTKAIALYQRLGFVQKAFPAYLLSGEEPISVYMERKRDDDPVRIATKNPGGARMKLSDIFEEKPKQWGFRGDPYFWDYLKERAKEMDMLSPDALEEWIGAQYLAVTGKVLTDVYGDFAVVEQFKHGGMSSGGVDNLWWKEKGIPLLKSRLPR